MMPSYEGVRATMDYLGLMHDQYMRGARYALERAAYTNNDCMKRIYLAACRKARRKANKVYVEMTRLEQSILPF